MTAELPDNLAFRWQRLCRAVRSRVESRLRRRATSGAEGSSASQPGFHNAADPNAWCLMTPCITLADDRVTVAMRIPEPHTRHASTEIKGRTLALGVLKSGNDPERAPLLKFYRRAVRLPAAVAGSCEHHFEGPYLIVVVPRALEQPPVTRVPGERSTNVRRASAREGGNDAHRQARMSANGSTPWAARPAHSAPTG